MTCTNNECEYKPTLNRKATMIISKKQDIAVITCNYSPTPDCNGNCEKCQHLLQAKIIYLNRGDNT